MKTVTYNIQYESVVYVFRYLLSSFVFCALLVFSFTVDPVECQYEIMGNVFL